MSIWETTTLPNPSISRHLNILTPLLLAFIRTIYPLRTSTHPRARTATLHLQLLVRIRDRTVIIHIDAFSSAIYS